jgi:hypothetical protein
MFGERGTFTDLELVAIPRSPSGGKTNPNIPVSCLLFPPEVRRQGLGGARASTCNITSAVSFGPVAFPQDSGRDFGPSAAKAHADGPCGSATPGGQSVRVEKHPELRYRLASEIGTDSDRQHRPTAGEYAHLSRLTMGHTTARLPADPIRITVLPAAITRQAQGIYL